MYGRVNALPYKLIMHVSRDQGLISVSHDVFGVLSIFLIGLKNYNNIKSIFLESTDHLKNKFNLKLKTVAVTWSHVEDLEKKYPKNSGIFVIMRQAN